jgi:hypothetical protein
MLVLTDFQEGHDATCLVDCALNRAVQSRGRTGSTGPIGLAGLGSTPTSWALPFLLRWHSLGLPTNLVPTRLGGTLSYPKSSL